MLGLPWGHRKKLSETDAVLWQALASYEARVCSCCGQWAKDAHDPAKAGAWQVHTDFTCYAGAALDKFHRERRESKTELEPGVRPYVALRPVAGSAAIDAEQQAAERRAIAARNASRLPPDELARRRAARLRRSPADP